MAEWPAGMRGWGGKGLIELGPAAECANGAPAVSRRHKPGEFSSSMAQWQWQVCWPAIGQLQARGGSRVVEVGGKIRVTTAASNML